MQRIETDVVVVGVGPGGEYAANKLGRAGLDVVAVDAALVGGECPFYGCTPSKLLIRAADLLAEARRAVPLAGPVQVEPDFSLPAQRIRRSTNDWHDHGHTERLEESGVRIVRGHGRLDGARRVVVEPTDGSAPLEVVARRGVILNPGTLPTVPPIEGLEGTPYLTNREVFRLEELPRSLVVLGGGPIGCELAQVYARFGSQVTLVQSVSRLMRNEEPEVGEVLARVFRAEGIDVRTDVQVTRVSHDGREFHLASERADFRAEHLLVAAGRTPNLQGLGLETVGLDPEADDVPTDERMRATDGVWVLGDVTGKGAYTHVSRYQAAVAVRDLLGEDGPWAEYHAVSRATFTDPEVGSVGLTEAEARARGIDVAVGVADIARSSRGWIHGDDTQGVIKVVADRERGILVGATAVSPAGGEVIGLLTTAVHARVPIATLRQMHFAYLTFHRAIEAALARLA